MCIQGSNLAFPPVLFIAQRKQQYLQILSALSAAPKQVHRKTLHDRGFTLVELMVTVAVMALLITVGAPALTHFLLQAEQDSALHQIKNIYSFARQEAVHRQVDVSICPVSEPLPDQCGENWSCGMLVYIDQDGNNKFNLVTDIKLRELYFSDAIAVTWVRNNTGFNLKPDGTTNRNGTFRVYLQGLSVNKNLVISNVGRARFAEETDSKRDRVWCR
ncbi:GspH/FimT family pseudopilin [Amphritea sp. HPY]|uniref:GspH/FimT family pseudopilin n=1 Tax=Amphritea sp. HPY TaxID=3421652 RepID=UPI003D7C86FC